MSRGTTKIRRESIQAADKDKNSNLMCWIGNSQSDTGQDPVGIARVSVRQGCDPIARKKRWRGRSILQVGWKSKRPSARQSLSSGSVVVFKRAMILSE